MNNQKETNNGAFIKISEQPSLYNNLEKKSVREILDEINTEDQKVALAVQRAIPQIEKLVNQIVPRMKQGGRIFYMGAGTSGRLGVLDASEIPPTFGMPNTLIIGLIAGGDTALRNPVENAEDDMVVAARPGHLAQTFLETMERVAIRCVRPSHHPSRAVGPVLDVRPLQIGEIERFDGHL